MKRLVTAWPGAVRERDRRGNLLLHLAVVHQAAPEVVRQLVTAWPEAGREKPGIGHSPLH